MKKNTGFHYTALISCIALVSACFIPWVHYNSINETFSGYDVKKFATGVYYGRPGIAITVFAGISFLLTIAHGTFVKKANLFVCGLLVAYTIRTYILFTGSLFPGEVTKLAGIYLMVLLSFVLLACSLFPKTDQTLDVKFRCPR